MRWPVSRIWGVGKVTQKALSRAGIHRIKQLRETPLETLRSIFGNQTQHVLDLAQGFDDRPVEPDREAKSISAEQTFAADMDDKESLLSILLTQVEEVSYRLRASHLCAKTLTIKLRYANFKTLTRSNSLGHPTNVTRTLWERARDLFLAWHAESARPLRLLGFGVSGLAHEGSGQGQLFPDPEDQKQKRLDEAFDAVRNRYGRGVLRHGK